MKILFASDIHGSYYYAKKVIEAFKTEKAEKLVLLGDLLYHGPRNPLPTDYDPMKVYELLNSMKSYLTAVRGNCDSEVDQMVLEFPCMADYTELFADNLTIFVTHGHLFNEEKLPPFKGGEVLIHGHTHISVLEKRDNYTLINPGSVSLPKDGIRGYVIYENREFVQKSLDGEVIARLVL